MEQPEASKLEAKHSLKLSNAIEEKGKKQTSEAVVRFPELAGFLFCVGDVKVSTRRVVCKPTCQGFQYHQTPFYRLEALSFSRVMKKNQLWLTLFQREPEREVISGKNLTLGNINLTLNLGY
jgi:hypothetical protein